MRVLPVEKIAVAEAHMHRTNKKVKKELLNIDKTLKPKVKEKSVSLRDNATAGRNAAESSEQNEEKMRMALDASGYGIWDWDLINKKLILSEKCRQILGFKPDLHVSYESFLNALHPEDREQIEKAIADALISGDNYDGEMRILWPDNTIHWVASKGKGVYRDGKPVRMIGVASDITEKRRIEHDLITDEKLKSVGRLAGGIAHDFNNLLAIIQGNIELTRLIINAEDVVHDSLNAAQFAARQAAELTKRLITFASGGTPFKRKCDIREMLMDAIGSCLTDESVKGIYSLDNNLLPVNIDESQIRQVFRNIAINAKEAMPGGGIIKVDAKNIIVGHDDQLLLSEGFYVRISVEDTGEGIAEKKLPYIFDPYFSTKQRGSEKGMGLGLSVCYSIISKHDGCITVRSKEGLGSTFDIYLPAVNNEIHSELES